MEKKFKQMENLFNEMEKKFKITSSYFSQVLGLKKLKKVVLALLEMKRAKS